MTDQNFDNIESIGNGRYVKILTIDDDPVVRESIKEALSTDYFVLTAKDAYDGFEMAVQHHPDLILLDIIMPVVDGFSALLLLKEDDGTKDIPVIMVSSIKKKKEIIQAFRNGAFGYILKPFTADELRVKIAKAFNKPPA